MIWFGHALYKSVHKISLDRVTVRISLWLVPFTVYPFVDYLVVFLMLKIDCKTSEINEGYEKLVYYAPSTPTTRLHLGRLVVIGKG